MMHFEFLPKGRTINKEYYFEVVRRLREAIRSHASATVFTGLDPRLITPKLELKAKNSLQDQLFYF